ncbi:MAG: MerR family transcriptional regulator [Deltaproteobacteria bacterium]|nr:MerR family transcriptional regulator [Deltaproteobacteria bacterium]MBW2048323.1 MerR family transcriptional regulator [Deltaproteobacteria bacterium]MBW2110342.1 MerR family transcriptional regulator [Deltaproteobacteria bacterium]MBW2353051.1 MerR family transcriptional regulator [Deltaproteobacteria bacterium]
MVRIPDNRRYFRIGEASRIVGVEPYVLRYWESEFPQLRPGRADSRQRTYQKKDLQILLEIKRLLYEERMTIEGARRRLKKETTGGAVIPDPLKREITGELQEILEILR